VVTAGSHNYFTSSSEHCVCFLLQLSSICMNANSLLLYALKFGRCSGGSDQALRPNNCSDLFVITFRILCKIFEMVFFIIVVVAAVCMLL